jgi:hypothetical protein
VFDSAQIERHGRATMRHEKHRLEIQPDCAAVLDPDDELPEVRDWRCTY